MRLPGQEHRPSSDQPQTQPLGPTQLLAVLFSELGLMIEKKILKTQFSMIFPVMNDDQINIFVLIYRHCTQVFLAKIL